MNTRRACKLLDNSLLRYMHSFHTRPVSGVVLSSKGSQPRTSLCTRTLSLDQRLQSELSAKTENKGSTYDKKEVDKFSRLAGKWWDQRGEFAALQTLNELRVPLIRDALTAQDFRQSDQPSSKSLEGYTVLDIGCGGGILTEPLARLGASVTGVDASYENIEAAKQHASLDPSIHSKIQYRCSLVEDLVHSDLYDGVIASEILEHVSDARTFLSSCCQLVKPGGSLFITTINRTMLSGALAVFAAERIFKVVPVGAHDWNKFVTPEELQDILQSCGMVTRLLHGMLLNPITLRWSWTKESPMNYALHAVKTLT